MTDGEALLRAILDAPCEDTPRLAYADWLEERGGVMGCRAVGPHHGDFCDGGRVQAANAQFTTRCGVCRGGGTVPDAAAARAEFIRLQVKSRVIRGGGCRVVLGTECDGSREWCVRCGMHKRERELLNAYAVGWWNRPEWALVAEWEEQGRDGGQPRAFLERGFVGRIRCSSAEWLRVEGDLYWNSSQTAECRKCRGNSPSWKYRPAGQGMYDFCESCNNAGRVSRPCPPTAQPLQAVTLTSFLPLVQRFKDGFSEWSIAGKGAWVGVETLPAQIAVEWELLKREWPGVSFRFEIGGEVLSPRVDNLVYLGQQDGGES